MFRNYFLIAWRSTVRHKGYALMNTTGLAVGLAVFIAALVYVNYERSYDRWDAQLDRVYRAGITEEKHGAIEEHFWTPYALGNQLSQTCPEVAAVTRIIESGDQLVTVGESGFYEKQLINADSAFFSVFPFRFVEGNRALALSQPGRAVITTDMARKLFGNRDAIGQTIDVATAYRGKKTYIVSGVIEKTGPSHLNFNICLSYFNNDPERWGRRIFQSYVLLQPQATLSALQPKARQLYVAGETKYDQSMQDDDDPATANNKNRYSKTAVFFEPAADIHLRPRATGWRDAAANHPVWDSQAGNHIPVNFFSIAALLILLLACINYSNLSIARSNSRAKESGMRKVMGAPRAQLMVQFLTEVLLHCLAALAIALLLAQSLVWLVNNYFGLQLTLWNNVDTYQNWQLILQLGIVILTVTLVSGGYPAVVLSNFKPAVFLKGTLTKGIRGQLLRNGLVVLQFTIAACFIVGLLVTSQQLRFMRQNDPGFDTDQVLVLHPARENIISPGEEGEQWARISEQLRQLPGVQQVTVAGAYPGMPSMAVQEAQYGNKTTDMTFNYIWFDYFKLLNMPVVAGRDFSRTYALDSVNAAVVNETAARQLGFANPLGQRVNILNRDYTIIGVLKDNHIAGYNTPIAPAIYAIGAEKWLMGGYGNLLVKLEGKQAAQTAAAISDYWKSVEPGFPLRYSWLDESFAHLIASYERFGKITSLLAIISTLIALMGIFALSAYTAGQRTQEIGIRKVLGATVPDVAMLLSKDFVRLVAIALLIAFPLGYIAAARWLEDFAYRTSIGWPLFVAAGAGILLIALLTVSFQAIKAAMANPVKSLRAD